MSTRTETVKKAAKSKQRKDAQKTQRRGREEGRKANGKVKKAERAEKGQGVAGGEAATIASSKEAALAFARVRPEIDAMPPAAELGRITVAIPAAVTIGLGALPNIESRQGEMREQLPNYDYERAGRLREYAYAAVHAHYQVALSAEGEVKIRTILVEAAPLRERLLRAAELHAHYGILDAELVSAIRQGSGHLDTANDLAQLALLFRQSHDKLSGQTPVTEADLDRAAELSNELLDALGRRRVGTDGASTRSKEEEDRIKAFWLFYDVYEESRRAMAHVRWYEGDADRLVPSLFLGHRRRSSTQEEPGEGDGDGGETPVDPSEGD